MNSVYQLTNKIALITGGAEGIGLGIAREYVSQGAKVIITGRTETKLVEAKKLLGKECEYFVNDVSQKELHSELIQSIEETYGPIDILVNNAGMHMKKETLEITNREFESVMDINVNSVFSLTIAVLPGMMERKKGSIIFISSMAALYGLPKVISYSASKTALLGLARSLSTEYGYTGIRFNCIAPGFIETKMLLKAVRNDPERKQRILKRTPVGRFGTIKEVGYTAGFLASDASEFITGTCIPVDGGNSIGF